MPVSIFFRFGCRVYQKILYVAAFFLPWRIPNLIKGEGCTKQLPSFIRGKKLQRAFLVTDPVIMNLGLANQLIDGLKKEGLRVTIYKEVAPNPTIDTVERALLLYQESRSDHLIALGGGSVMDVAKLVGARAVRPRTPIPKLRGIFGVLGVLRRLPPLFAIPTTAGTGSETTLAAVVCDPSTKQKYAIMDTVLIPPYAVLDPLLTIGLPQFVTATTGMDTLTHAVEAYTNLQNNRQTEEAALLTVKLVFQNLKKAYVNGKDLQARENMQEAAFYGGVAFTRAYVGNVHAVAHVLGAYYDVPHGYANAIILPHVLEKYGSAIYDRLADLADAAGIQGATNAERAKNFIAEVKKLNKELNIPENFKGDAKYAIKDADIPAMVKQALHEANPLYPVPVIFGEEEMRDIFKAIQ